MALPNLQDGFVIFEKRYGYDNPLSQSIGLSFVIPWQLMKEKTQWLSDFNIFWWIYNRKTKFLKKFQKLIQSDWSFLEEKQDLIHPVLL